MSSNATDSAVTATAAEAALNNLVGVDQVPDSETGVKLLQLFENKAQELKLQVRQKLFDEDKVEEAAELGLPKAQGEMARRCFYGRDGVAKGSLVKSFHGVAKGLDKCVEWAKKAAAGGDKVGQFWLGRAYDEGEIAWAAIKWYEKAADQGCTIAMTYIGNLYYTGGYGVTKNLTTAVSWYREAAEAGEAEGQHNLGESYYHGEGVTKNLETALDWFKKAADQGQVDAICDLGSMMVKGEGGAKRISEGCQWLEKAAAKGHKNAQVILDKMSNYEVHTQMINDLNSAQSELAAANRQLNETVEGLRKAALSENNLLAACDTDEESDESYEAEEITLADGTTVYYVEETGLCYSTNGEMEEIGSYNSETNSLEESKEGEDRPVITLADGTTVYYVEDTGLCYSTNGGIQPLGSYNSDTNSLEELNLTP